MQSRVQPGVRWGLAVPVMLASVAAAQGLAAQSVVAAAPAAQSNAVAPASPLAGPALAGQQTEGSPAMAPAPVDKAAYVLGTGDQLTVRVFGADDLPERPTEIGPDGEVNLPMLGKVQAAGISVRRLEAELNTRYAKYFKDPQVAVAVTDYRSQPVTVAGAVNTPSVIELHGPTRLMQVLSQAGGLKPDAGNRVIVTRTVVTRGAAGASADTGDSQPRFTVSDIDLARIMDGSDPAANMLIEANDIISVPKAKLVYVVGDVNKPGGYVLDGHSSSLSVLQAIALAGGVDKTANASKVKILRAATSGETQRTEAMINLDKIMASENPDPLLHADDILFVPDSRSKRVGIRALEMAVNVGTGMAIWRF